jgi:phenylacetate-coenzyme A ligase PaaK-like adenylate-forming protein
MSKVDELLEMKPFQNGKSEAFLEAMRESLQLHYGKCELYRKFCQKNGFDPHGKYSLEEIPFFPVNLFKTVKLISVDEKDIVKRVSSSATTSGVPSRVYLDSITAKRQVKALNSIMSSFIGKERKTFAVFDSPETVKSLQGELSSRGTAIRGFLPLSKSMVFLMDKNLNLDGKALKEIASEENVCFLGFTFLIYQIMEKHRNDAEVAAIMKCMKDSLVLHLGGWKKLQELNISKPAFNQELARFLSTQENRVIDIYGMVEQLGTIYPDCEFGYKHVPVYSEIIIRDTETLKPVRDGREGFIQLLTPLPHSYPGVSVISDDIGVIMKEDGCECGRKGKAFLFRSRAQKAELKGCGDTIQKHPE